MVVLVAVIVVARLYVDWLWFGEAALRQVFWTRLWYGLALGALFGCAFFAIVYGNVAVARRLAPKIHAFEGIDVVEYVHEGASHRVRQVALVVTALIALRVGFGAAGSWLTFARALNRVPFEVRDPIFHHDLGFYVFTLPAWQYVYTFLFATLVVALIAALATHLILGGVWLEMREIGSAEEGGRSRLQATLASGAIRGIRFEKNCIAHLSALLAALFIVGGAGYLMKAWNLLLSTSGAVFGAGYTDVHVRLPIIRALMVFAL